MTEPRPNGEPGPAPDQPPSVEEAGPPRRSRPHPAGLAPRRRVGMPTRASSELPAGQGTGGGEALPYVDDRASKIWVAIVIGSFALLFAYVLLLGKGGALTPKATPLPVASPSASVSVSGAPVASGSPAAGSPGASVSVPASAGASAAAPSPSAAASRGAGPSPSTSPVPSPSAS